MSHSKMVKKYPELLGVYHDKQLEIVKRARQEIHSGRNERIIKAGIIIGVFIIFGIIRAFIPSPDFWIKTASALMPVFACYFVCTWYYRKRFRQKLVDLVQKEKQQNLTNCNGT